MALSAQLSYVVEAAENASRGKDDFLYAYRLPKRTELVIVDAADRLKKEVRNKAIFDSLDLKKRPFPYSTVGEQNRCKTILPHETRGHQGKGRTSEQVLLITAQPIHRSVTYLVDHLPHQLHLIMATRADPPLPLARLRTRGHLTEIRPADLRFTSEETTAFLTRTLGLHLSDEDITALETRTEGWLSGDVGAASIARAEASHVSWEVTHLYAVFLVTHDLAYLQILQGHLHQADQTYRQALQQALERSGHQPAMGPAYVGRGNLEREWNHLDAAASLLQAKALHASGEVNQAIERLSRSLSLTEPEGYIRLFVDEGAPIARLLVQMRAGKPTPFSHPLMGDNPPGHQVHCFSEHRW